MRSFNGYCADLLWTFFSHHVHPLRQREMTMQTYPVPSCPFSKELSDMEINTQICGVLAHGVILNLGTSPIPLREGIDNP
jgi:hypothetical protein